MKFFDLFDQSIFLVPQISLTRTTSGVKRRLSLPSRSRLGITELASSLALVCIILIPVSMLMYDTAGAWADPPREIWDIARDQDDYRKPRPVTRFAISGIRIEIENQFSAQPLWIFIRFFQFVKFGNGSMIPTSSHSQRHFLYAFLLLSKPLTMLTMHLCLTVLRVTNVGGTYTP